MLTNNICNSTMEISLATMLICLMTVAESVYYINETVLTDPACNLHEHARIRRSFYRTKDPLYCPPCEQIHCYKHRKKRLNCKGGYTVGVCGCCRVCAKVENEQCGGDHNYLGRCDKGLLCEPQPPTEVTFHKDGVKTVYKVHKGICKINSKVVSPNPDHCKPACSAEYCNKNPRSICSARYNVENSKTCQGKCQHTSCRACRFVQSEKQCPKCNFDDFKCLRDFGRCARRKMCKQLNYPCGKKKAVQKDSEEFICFVPECF